jgi:hypothetical protein
MRGRAGSAAVALLILCALSGCSSGISSILASSVAQAQSAVQTARLTLVQLRGGRVQGGVATTAFADMLREAQDAESTAAATPSTAEERAVRDRVLPLLHDATRAILQGQDAAERAPGAPSTVAAIHRLDLVLPRLQAEARRLGSGR